ncbi:MAG: hypothetical protein ACREN7_02510 [Candidatus Dormibacteria bacterium]
MHTRLHYSTHLDDPIGFVRAEVTDVGCGVSPVRAAMGRLDDESGQYWGGSFARAARSEPALLWCEMRLRRLPPEDIGLLTPPVEREVWAGEVSRSVCVVTGLDDDEKRIAACNAGDRYAASQFVVALHAT